MEFPARTGRLLLVTAITAVLAVAFTANITEAQQQEEWEVFTIEELAKRRAEQGSAYLRFLDRETLSAGVYELSAGGVDRQSPHELDEVYYIIEGKATLTVGSDEVPVRAGSVVYVERGVPHRFHSIAEDLQVLVFFSRAK